MAKRRWSGILTVEGKQTGDGRFLAPGSIETAPLPLPFNWMQESMHGMANPCPQIGVIDTIEKANADGGIPASGYFDDEIPEAAEFIRRLEAGSASHGESAFVSIDPDNWEVEIIIRDEDEAGDDEFSIVATGRAREGETWALRSPFRQSLTAAAGDGDPADEGAVLFSDSVDEVVERYTRLRIRGVTAVDIPAFDGAFISLDGEATEDETETPEEEPEAVEASALTSFAPPAQWFDDPQLSELTALTITDEGRLFGHVAPWKQCHIGIQNACVMAPRSLTNYAYFTTGVLSAEGCDCDIPVGVITMDTDHLNDLSAGYQAATAHYANTGTQAAWVVAGEDDHGIWISGAINPSLSEDQINTLRAGALSGDWRPIGAGSELVAILAVNVPGFPIPRTRAKVELSTGKLEAMVAGANFVVPQPDAEEEFRAEVAAWMKRVDRSLKHLKPTEREAILASIGPAPKPAKSRLDHVRRVNA